MDLPGKIGPEVEDYLAELEKLEAEHQREVAETQEQRQRELAELRIREINRDKLLIRLGDVHFGAAMAVNEVGFRRLTIKPNDTEPRSTGIIIIDQGKRDGRPYFVIGEVTTNAIAGESNNFGATTTVRYGAALEKAPNTFDESTNTDPNQGIDTTVSGKRLFFRWLKTESTDDPVITTALDGDFRDAAPEAVSKLTSIRENVRDIVTALTASPLNTRPLSYSLIDQGDEVLM